MPCRSSRMRPGTTSTVLPVGPYSGLLRRDGLIRDVRSGADRAEVSRGIVEKRTHEVGGVGLIAVAQRVGIRVDQLAERGQILVAGRAHVHLRALREPVAQRHVVETARRIVTK